MFINKECSIFKDFLIMMYLLKKCSYLRDQFNSNINIKRIYYE